ncbi:MAG TPA: TOBE domain-containing protein, partial [Candidatus Acidoferrum sp.]|nr:TOBE domain-containing protein [Candidatus Acidoferrum sp.]
QAGEAVTLVVRPETLRLAPASDGGVETFQGIIRRVVYLGSTIEYEIDWNGTTLLAVIGSPLEHGLLPEGSRVAFDFPASTAHILPHQATPIG